MDEIPSNFPERGKIKKKNLPLIPIASRQTNSLHNSRVIHKGFQVKKALRLGSQAVNRCVSLPVQNQAFRTRASNTSGSQMGSRWGVARIGYGHGVRRRNHKRTGPITLARARIMAEAGQAEGNPLSSVVTEP